MDRIEFLQHIAQFLEPMKFQRTDDIWSLEHIVQEPGRMMIINGQQFQQPGRTHQTKISIQCAGECSVTTNGNEQPDAYFEMIGFECHEHNNTFPLVSHWEGIYYDQYEYFEELFRQIFKF